MLQVLPALSPRASRQPDIAESSSTESGGEALENLAGILLEMFQASQPAPARQPTAAAEPSAVVIEEVLSSDDQMA